MEPNRLAMHRGLLVGLLCASLLSMAARFAAPLEDVGAMRSNLIGIVIGSTSIWIGWRQFRRDSRRDE